MADPSKQVSDVQSRSAVTKEFVWLRLTDSEWANRLFLLAILLVVSVGSALMASQGIYSQTIPELRKEDLGRPFRGAALGGFKASRDYEVLHEAATQKAREEARRGVKPVFDYDPSVQSSVARAIDDAFAQMQDVVEQFHSQRQPKTEARTADANPADNGAVKKRPAETKEEAELISTRLKEAKESFESRFHAIDDDDFAALAQARFSSDAQRAALALVEMAYRSKLTSFRDELQRVDANGITVRILGGTSEYNIETRKPGELHGGSSVMDVNEARDALDRFVSIPGNFLPDTPAALRRAVLRWVKRELRANLNINLAETEERRKAAFEAVQPVTIPIKKGQTVIGDGEPITATHLLEVQAMREQTDQIDLFKLQFGGAANTALLVLALWLFLGARRDFRPTLKDAAFIGVSLVGFLGLLNLWVTIAAAIHDRYPRIPIEAMYFFFPVAAGAMLVQFVLAGELALFFSLIFSCLCGVMLGNSLSVAAFSLVTSWVAADRIAKAKDRGAIFQAGLWTGGVGGLFVIFLNLAQGQAVWSESLLGAAFALVSGTLAVPAMVMALTPLVESAFGYASDIKLLELANLNHPALKELIVQAPGTYHHSIIMGSLVEAAAEQIGANPLLARSCAYYHDIGKGRNPIYFGENQKGENRHDTLSPAMSAVIIKRHVTEGIEMARQYKLPRRVAAAIPEHHGTRLVGFFFHKAKKELEGKDASSIDESVYRYPGPKPQSRETALVMIADAVEAASRSMPDPTSASLQALVQKLINMIFSEGQLDECDLTLKDLHLITQSFVRTLEGIYHARPSYPPGALITGPQKPALTLAKEMPEPTRKAGTN